MDGKTEQLPVVLANALRISKRVPNGSSPIRHFAARVWVGLAIVAAVLGVDRTHAAVISEDDPRLFIQTDNFEAPDGDTSVYVVRPVRQAGPLPAILLVHGSHGLDEQFRAIARRLALQDFVVVAPDFLATSGGTPEDENLAREMLSQLSPETALETAISAIGYIIEMDETNRQKGAIGFSWGGSLVNRLIVESDEVAAAVVFNGRAPALEEVPQIEAALLLYYAASDTAEPADYANALEEAEVLHDIRSYEGPDQPFSEFSEEGAGPIWQTTVEFLDGTLK